MCGIIGILANRTVVDELVEGLKRLEYRGYDSAGIATLENGKISRRRAEGKIKELERVIKEKPVTGVTGIAHTRWATHGAPVENNAHPHATDKVAVVHNGIIENFAELRKELEAKGYAFQTDTDTEVVPQLITFFLDQGKKPVDAVRAAVKRFEGAFALGILFAGEEDLLIAARRGSPLAVGFGADAQAGEYYLGSDALALAGLGREISYLEDGDLAVLTRRGIVIEDSKGKKAERKRVVANVAQLAIGKENYRHFMLKEIYEQPNVISNVLRAYCNPVQGKMHLPELDFDLSTVSRVTVVACGTSYYAGFISKYWCELGVGIPVDVDIASEFRYRRAPLEKGGLAVFISQSGETADTLAALRYAKEKGQHTIAVVNVTESTMAREADSVLPIYCGPEIGVASTKAFTAQLATLGSLVLALGSAKGTMQEAEIKRYTHALSEVPARMAEVLSHDNAIRDLAQELMHARDMIYIGRGISYGLAMEGALKLKEISYIHAEAAAAGELKHGPIALIDEEVPVVVIAPSDDLFDKTASNVREVAARGGKIVLLSDAKGVEALKDVTWHAIAMPPAAPIVTPILYAIPIQLIAYHVAVAKGTDVDQPRNLAKSVTVE